MSQTQTPQTLDHPQALDRPLDEFVWPLLPTETDSIDPVRTLAAIHHVIEETPRTALGIHVGVLEDELGTQLQKTNATLEPLFEMTGSWRLRNSGARNRPRFANPDYVHLSATANEETRQVTETDARLEVLERSAKYGTLMETDVEPRFDLSPEGMCRFVARQEFDWERKRSEGIARLARTCLVLREIGYEDAELAAALDVPGGLIRDMIARCAPETIDIPQDVAPGLKTDFQPA